MKSWVLWMIHNHFAWLVKVLLVVATPVHLVQAYSAEAWDDIKSMIDCVDEECRK